MWISQTGFQHRKHTSSYVQQFLFCFRFDKGNLVKARIASRFQLAGSARDVDHSGDYVGSDFPVIAVSNGSC